MPDLEAQFDQATASGSMHEELEKFEFKPLEAFELPGIGNLRCEGLIVIVGPNSSGKSQLLQDIFMRLCGEPRALVVATSLEVQKPAEYPQFARWLENEGYFETIFDDNGAEQWKPKTTYVGQGGAVNQIQPSQARNWHDTFVPTSDRTTKRRSEFLNYFGRLLVTALFLDRRLSAMNSVGLIDFEGQPPQHELHALYLDDDARERLYTELVETFGKAVWPDPSRGNLLSLRVSDQGILPTAEDRLSPKKMARFRTIETEGDGLKSYVAICVALLLGRRPICLIDEPEMCLHPPQAHNLGRFIGKHASTSSNVTLAATHSSQILRGIIQTAPRVQIVRLTRSKGDFSAHLVPADVLADAVAKPTVRAESVLDGIFAQGVIVLEADSDRLVYQTTWETMAEEFHQDIHFATVGGTGGIADTCKLYRTLKIPVAVVADLDVIADPTKLKRILEVMADPARTEDLVAKARSVAEAIRKEPPTISPAAVKDSLSAIVLEGNDWEEEADIKVRRELNRLAEQLDRMRQLKRGGIAGLPVSVAEEATSLLRELSSEGIFLVPVGELEEWLETYEIQNSKRNKWAWANSAAQIIQERGRQQGDVWDFMQSVGQYLLENYG
jgi:hypothetical protein